MKTNYYGIKVGLQSQLQIRSTAPHISVAEILQDDLLVLPSADGQTIVSLKHGSLVIQDETISAQPHEFEVRLNGSWSDVPLLEVVEFDLSRTPFDHAVLDKVLGHHLTLGWRWVTVVSSAQEEITSRDGMSIDPSWCRRVYQTGSTSVWLSSSPLFSGATGLSRPIQDHITPMIDALFASAEGWDTLSSLALAEVTIRSEDDAVLIAGNESWLVLTTGSLTHPRVVRSQPIFHRADSYVGLGRIQLANIMLADTKNTHQLILPIQMIREVSSPDVQIVELGDVALLTSSHPFKVNEFVAEGKSNVNPRMISVTSFVAGAVTGAALTSTKD